MKRLYGLALATSLLLVACAAPAKQDSQQEKTSTTPTSTLSSDQQKAQKRLEDFQAQYEKDVNTALYDSNAYFPQLSTSVADDEAEAILHTSKGDIRVKLFPKQAPLAVENFLTHAKEGYYNGVTFHRVIQDFMIQTGDPKGDGTGGESIWKGKDASIDSGNGFMNEPSPFLYHIRGALSMANAGENTNGSQFFIVQNKDDQSSHFQSGTFPEKIIEAYKKGGYPSLDSQYTVFGQVLSGMDVVDAIAQTATDSNDKPKETITIQSIEVVKDMPTSK